jgi:DNA ligase-1
MSIEDLALDDSNDVANIIERIRETPSKNEKVDILKTFSGSLILRKVLKMGLNPLITYGVKKRPEQWREAGSGHAFDDDTWGLISRLSTRELSGNAALEAIEGEFEALNYESRELLWQIISKDFRAGFGQSTVNKAIKGLIPDFPYMRCSLPNKVNIEEWDWKGGIYSQEKADGMFVNINYLDGKVSFHSRQGTSFPEEPMKELAQDLEKALKLSGTSKNVQIHGELLVTNRAENILPREIGNGMLNSLAKGGKLDSGYNLLCQLWDIVPLANIEPKGQFDRHYSSRIACINKITNLTSLSIKAISTKTVHSIEDAYAHYAELLLEGKEGTIIKQREMIWRDSTSKGQVKLKLEVDVELKVVGFIEGEPGKKTESTFGALLCCSADGELEVGVSGFTDSLRQEIHDNRADWEGAIITVRSNAVLYKEGGFSSLFLPRFIERRTEKSEADDMQRIEDQFEAAKTGVAYVKK